MRHLSENKITTKLADRLDSSVLFANKIISFMLAEDVTFDEDSYQADEQIDSKNNGRPDIVIRDKNHLFYIENKTELDTDLTSNQIVKNGVLNYLVELSENAKKGNIENYGLIYLIPSNYHHIDKIDEAINLDKEHIKKVYWEDLIQFVETLEHNFPLEKVVFDEICKGFGGNVLSLANVNFSQYTICCTNPATLISVVTPITEIAKLIDDVYDAIKGYFKMVTKVDQVNRTDDLKVTPFTIGTRFGNKNLDYKISFRFRDGAFIFAKWQNDKQLEPTILAYTDIFKMTKADAKNHLISEIKKILDKEFKK